MKFHEYKTTYNADISNKFQYIEFDKYKKSEIVKIDISESTDQNTSTESSIESSAKTQNIDSPDASQNVLLETTNTSIISHHSKHN